MDAIARQYLDTYARGGEADGGWKYGKALQQSKLDYSEASLARLDHLLDAIRQQAKPSPEEMQDTAPGRNFCSLVCFYVIELVRRRTGAMIHWHDRDSALRALPASAQLPDAPFARLVVLCPDQGVAFLPLDWVEGRILGGEGNQAPSRDYVDDLVQQIERDAPAVWWSGMEAAGRIASWQMMMAADGGEVPPTLLGSTAPMTWRVLTGPGAASNVDEALQRGGQILESNPEGAAWQVLSYDGYAEIDGERFDAVLVILYTYGDAPLRMKLAFPYTPPKSGRALAIHQPSLRDANVANEQIAMLQGALERGIQSVKWAFGKTWNELRSHQP